MALFIKAGVLSDGRKYITFLAILILISPVLTAQVNESDTARFQLTASLTGIYQDGNVEYFSLRGRLDFSSRLTSEVVLKSQNNNLYQEFSGFKADNNLYSRNFLYYRPEARVYPFAIGFISSNFRQQLERRFFGGVGGTWQIVARPNHIVKFSLASVYETSLFRESNYNINIYDGSRNINLWRGTAYLSGLHQLADGHLQLSYESYWQPALEDGENYRIVADVGLESKVWKNLSLRLSYVYTSERVVIQGVKERDRLLLFGVSSKFRK